MQQVQDTKQMISSKRQKNVKQETVEESQQNERADNAGVSTRDDWFECATVDPAPKPLPHHVWEKQLEQSQGAVRRAQDKKKAKQERRAKEPEPCEFVDAKVEFKGGVIDTVPAVGIFRNLEAIVANVFSKRQAAPKMKPADKLEVVEAGDGSFKYVGGSLFPSVDVNLPFDLPPVAASYIAKFTKNALQTNSQKESQFVNNLLEYFHPIVVAAFIALPHKGTIGAAMLKHIPVDALVANIHAFAALTQQKKPLTGVVSDCINKRFLTDINYQHQTLLGFPPLGSRPKKMNKEGKMVEVYTPQQKPKSTNQVTAQIATRALAYGKAPLRPKVERGHLPAIAWCSTQSKAIGAKRRKVIDSGKDTVAQSEAPPILTFYSTQHSIEDQIIPMLKALPDKIAMYTATLGLNLPFDAQFNKVVVLAKEDNLPNPNNKVLKEYVDKACHLAKNEIATKPVEKVVSGILIHPVDPVLADTEIRQIKSQSVSNIQLTTIDEGSGIAVSAEILNLYADCVADATFQPLYYQAPFVPDVVSIKAITDAVDSGSKEQILEQIMEHRFTAGCALGQLNRYGKEMTVIKEKPKTILAYSSFLKPRMNVAQFGIQALKSFIDNGMYEINTKSSAGILWDNGKKSLGTTYIDLLYLNQIASHDWKLPEWLKLYYFKPKLENTNVFDMFAKTRSIFVMSSALNIPMAFLTKGIYDYNWNWSDMSSFRALIKTKCLLCVTQQDFLLGFQSLSEDQRNELADLAGGISLVAYSDNMYAIDWRSGEIASFDGVAMESQVSTSTIRTIQKLVKALWTSQAKKEKFLVKCKLEPGVHKNPLFGIRWEATNPEYLYGQEVLVDTIYKVFGYMEEITVAAAEDGFVEIVGAYDADWTEYDKVFDMYCDLLENGYAIAGSWKFPVNFLPSGWYWTTLCNTLVTLSYVKEIEKAGLTTMEQIREYVQESPTHFKFTVENEPHQSVFNENAHIDFLGFDIYKGGVALRKTSLFSGPFEHNPSNRGASGQILASLTAAKWVSAMFNGGVAYPELVYCFGVALYTLANLQVEVVLGQLDENLRPILIGEKTLNVEKLLEKAAQFAGYNVPPVPPGIPDTIVKFRTTNFERFTLRQIAQPNRVLRTAVLYLIAGVDPRNPRREITPGAGIWSAYVAELSQLAQQPMFNDKSIVRLLQERHPALFDHQRVSEQLSNVVVNAVLTNYRKMSEIDRQQRSKNIDKGVRKPWESTNKRMGSKGNRKVGRPSKFGVRFPLAPKSE